MIKISVNNQPQNLDVDQTLAQALLVWGYEHDAMFAVAVNREFVSKKTNEQIYKIIDLGGGGVRKSHLMPSFGHTLSQEEL